MQYLALSAAQRQAVLQYLTEFRLYDRCVVGGVPYLLTHSGLQNFEKNKPLTAYAAEDFLCARPQPDTVYDTEEVLIFGHTPTCYFHEDESLQIWYGQTAIGMDCGCGYPEGRLACLRLEDGKEFYSEEEGETQ